jgi:DNA relaxase NicK
MLTVGTTEQLALAPCNTQAQTAQEPEMNVQKHDLTRKGIDVLIDYVAITYKEDVQQVLARFGAELWWPTAHGWKGYKQGVSEGHVTIWYDGKPDQGVNVQISGQGCRELEAAGVVTDWVGWLREQLEVGRFSRLDVAMDERTPDLREAVLTRDAIQQAIDEQRVVSRYKFVDKIERQSLSDVSVGGWTRNFGSAMSETKIRTYDKAAEQGISEAYHWMRVEIQTRREKAHELARVMIERGLMGVASVIQGLLDFKQQGTHSQRERWETCSWWSAFLGEVEKLRLTVRPAVRTLSDIMNWLHRNVAPLLAVAVASERGRAIKTFLPRLLLEGEQRWKTKHLALLQPA